MLTDKWFNICVTGLFDFFRRWDLENYIEPDFTNIDLAVKLSVGRSVRECEFGSGWGCRSFLQAVEPQSGKWSGRPRSISASVGRREG